MLRIKKSVVFRSLWLLFSLFLFMLLPGLSQAQTTHPVNVGQGGAKFAPIDITINVGDTVHWVWVNGTHNVISYPSAGRTEAGVTYSCHETFGSPNLSPPSTFDHTFTTAGECDYKCTIHTSANTPAGQGMRGHITVVVGPVNQPPYTPLNVSPSNGGTVYTLTPTLTASAFSDPNSGDTHYASRWQVTLSSDIDFVNTVWDSGTDTAHKTSVVVPSGMAYGSTYRWHVSYSDNKNDPNSSWSDWSTPTTFSVAEDNTPVGTGGLSRFTINSGRALVGTGDNRLIQGFFIEGDVPKSVLIRARGPSLAAPPFNHTGVLADPTVKLYSGGIMIAQNDNWQDPPDCVSGYNCGDATKITATVLDPCQPNPGETTPPPNCNMESAVLISLPAGTYSAVVSGVNSGTGLGLVEVFEIETITVPRLINLSGRAQVGTGNNREIGGFVISGSDPKTVLIRGRGPSMAAPPINMTGVLADPMVKLYSSTGLIAQNDDWQGLPNCPGYTCGGATEITATGQDPCQPNTGETTSPPNCNKESAILITLSPGIYSAVLSGVGHTTRVGAAGAYEIGTIIRPRLIDGSSRANVQTGDNRLIEGIKIEGGAPKRVLLRTNGPSLGLTGVLADPTMILRDSGGITIAQNDNWQDAPDCVPGYVCEPIPSGLAPSNTKDSAILITLPPGTYSAVVSGVNGGTGIALAEILDQDIITVPKLINNSVRAQVGTGDNRLIGGFTIEGNSDIESNTTSWVTVLIRARGPSLSAPPINMTGVLANPTVKLYSSTGLIAQNDNWQDAPNCLFGYECGVAAEITATGQDPCQPNQGETTPPANCNMESAILIKLPPGSYSFVVSGVGNTTGVGLAEVFEISTSLP